MNTACWDFGKNLDAYVGGTLAPEQVGALEAHLADCSRCTEIVRIVRGDAAPRTPATQDFVDTLLQRTSGPSCRRSRESLCDFADGVMPAVEADLMRSHLDHCAACASLQRALVALRLDTRQLVGVEPDAGFTADVLRQTSRRRPIAGRLQPAVFWRRLLARPRFAWEFAWATTAVLAMLCSTPQAPLRDLPAGALTLLRLNPVSVARAAAQPIERSWAVFGDNLSQAWGAGGRRINAWSLRATERLRRPQVTGAWHAVQEQARSFGRTFWAGDWAAAGQRLQDLGSELARLWSALRGPDTDRGPPTAMDA